MSFWIPDFSGKRCQVIMKPWRTALQHFQINCPMTSWWALNLFTTHRRGNTHIVTQHVYNGLVLGQIPVSWAGLLFLTLQKQMLNIYSSLLSHIVHVFSHLYAFCFVSMGFSVCSFSIRCAINRCHLALWPSCLGSWCTQTRSRCCSVTTGSPSARPSRLRR